MSKLDVGEEPEIQLPNGISKRLWIATHVLQGMIANGNELDYVNRESELPMKNELSRVAFDVADALIEQEKGGGNE